MSDKLSKMRATLHRVGNVPGSASLSIIGGLYIADRKEWRRVADQREAWAEWADEQRRWSEHKCYIHPTCDVRSVRWKVQAINSILETLFLVGHKYTRTQEPECLELGRELYWLLFDEYSQLSIYLEFGDDYVKQWMKSRGMEVPV
jgi:hypothetical protein